MLITDAQYDVVYGKVEEKRSLWNRVLSSISNYYGIDPDKISEQLEKGQIYRLYFRRHNSPD